MRSRPLPDYVRSDDLGLTLEEMRRWVRENYPTAVARVGLDGRPCWAADEIGLEDEGEDGDE